MPKEDTQTVTICHGLLDKIANGLRWIIFRCWLMSIGAIVGEPLTALSCIDDAGVRGTIRDVEFDDDI